MTSVRKSSKRAGRHHSIYAIGHYLGAVERVAEELEKAFSGDQLGNAIGRIAMIEALLNVIPDMLHDTLPPARRFNDAVATRRRDAPERPRVSRRARRARARRSVATLLPARRRSTMAVLIVNARTWRTLSGLVSQPEDRKRVRISCAKAPTRHAAEDGSQELGHEVESVTEARSCRWSLEMCLKIRRQGLRPHQLAATTRAWMDDGKILRSGRALPARQLGTTRRVASTDIGADGRIKKELMANPAELAAARPALATLPRE